jgi:hypothetical protein
MSCRHYASSISATPATPFQLAFDIAIALSLMPLPPLRHYCDAAIAAHFHLIPFSPPRFSLMPITPILLSPILYSMPPLITPCRRASTYAGAVMSPPFSIDYFYAIMMLVVFAFRR